MYSTPRDTWYETLRQLLYEDIPHFCRTNRQINQVCQSSLGQAIIKQKRIDRALDLMERFPLLSGRYNELLTSYTVSLLEQHPTEASRLLQTLIHRYGFIGPTAGPVTQYSPNVNAIFNLLWSDFSGEDEIVDSIRINDYILDLMENIGLRGVKRTIHRAVLEQDPQLIVEIDFNAKYFGHIQN